MYQASVPDINRRWIHEGYLGTEIEYSLRIFNEGG